MRSGEEGDDEKYGNARLKGTFIPQKLLRLGQWGSGALGGDFS
jgi:hypothetical protein